MKNWRTSLLGVLIAGIFLAIAKGWIDKEVGAFIETALIALFGVASTDSKKFIGGSNPPPSKDEK